MPPLLLMILSTLCLSLSGFVAKYLEEIVPINVLLIARLFIPASIMLVAALWVKASVPCLRETLVISRRSVFIALTQFCFFSALVNLSLIELAVLFSTGPLFIPLIERVLYGVKLSLPVILTLLVSFTGLIIQSGILEEFDFQWGMGFGLLAGFFNACSQVSMYRASKIKAHSLMINGISFLVASILVLPVSFLMVDSSTSILPISLFPYVILIAVMGGLSIGTQLFRTSAYRKAISTAELAPIFYLNILISALMQFLFFDERFTSHQILGLSLIVTSCVAYSYLSVLKIKR
ncbi:DMT family transporter [Vibrio algivorus]|uniref:DMT family transporter n=1 Tax=Vibrio algivorus TaxID=1667024 RepID=UPI000B5C2962|nr:DMT family transporter [Vibrio algivorus]